MSFDDCQQRRFCGFEDCRMFGYQFRFLFRYQFQFLLLVATAAAAGAVVAIKVGVLLLQPLAVYTTTVVVDIAVCLNSMAFSTFQSPLKV